MFFFVVFWTRQGLTLVLRISVHDGKSAFENVCLV